MHIYMPSSIGKDETMGSSQFVCDAGLKQDVRGDEYHELLEALSLSLRGQSSLSGPSLPIPLLTIIAECVTTDRDLILHISKHMKICSRFGSFIDDALFKGEYNLSISWSSSEEGEISYKDLTFLYDITNRIDKWEEWNGLGKNGVPRCARYI